MIMGAGILDRQAEIKPFGNCGHPSGSVFLCRDVDDATGYHLQGLKCIVCSRWLGSGKRVILIENRLSKFHRLREQRYLKRITILRTNGRIPF